MCKKLFLSPDVNKTTICSEKCRKKQQKLNKQKYDDEHRGDSLERTHKNEKQYWYNRLTKVKKRNCPKAIAEIEKGYEKFKKKSLELKHKVNEGKISYSNFYTYCIEGRNIVDDIMYKYDIADR